MVPKHLGFRIRIRISYLHHFNKIVIVMKTWSIECNHRVNKHKNAISNRFWLYCGDKKVFIFMLQSAVQSVQYLYSKGEAILIVQKRNSLTGFTLLGTHYVVNWFLKSHLNQRFHKIFPLSKILELCCQWYFVTKIVLT